MNKIAKSIIMIISCGMMTLMLLFNSMHVKAVQTDETVFGTGYSFGNRGNYDLSDKKSTYTYERIASITLSGDINLTTKYNGVTAFGVQSGNVSISLDYDGKWLDEKGERFILRKLIREFLFWRINA